MRIPAMCATVCAAMALLSAQAQQADDKPNVGPDAARATTVPDAAQDWPCYLGPNQGHSPLKGIKKDWAHGLTKLWELDVCTGPHSDGYSAPVVSRGRLVILGYEGDSSKTGKNVVYCLDAGADTVKPIWTTKLEPAVRGNLGEYEYAAEATPCIDGDAVYVLSVDAVLSGLDMKDGKVLWTHDLPTEEKWTRVVLHGTGGSPVVVGDVVIVDIGGTAYAYAKTDGKLVWKQTVGGSNDYATPVLARLQNRDELLFYTTLPHSGADYTRLVSVDPKSGEILWQVACGGGMFVGYVPVVVGDVVFVTSNFGCKAIKVGADGPKELWTNRNMSSEYHNGVVLDGYYYGTTGSMSQKSMSFKCLDFKTGNEQWSNDLGLEKLPYPHLRNPLAITAVDGCLLALGGRGTLYLIEPRPDALKVLGQVQAIQQKDPVLMLYTCYTAPVIAQGRVYLRGPRQVVCYDLLK